MVEMPRDGENGHGWRLVLNRVCDLHDVRCKPTRRKSVWKFTAIFGAIEYFLPLKFKEVSTLSLLRNRYKI